MATMGWDRNPKHSRHASGQGVVYLSRQAHYTGAWGTPEGEARYRELVNRWNAGGRAPLRAPRAHQGLTVDGLARMYLEHQAKAYRKREKVTTQYHLYDDALAHLRSLFGSRPAESVGLREIRAYQDRLARHVSRKTGHPYTSHTVNRFVGLIKAVWRWGIRQDLVPWSAWLEPRVVEPRKRSQGRIMPPVRPAPEADVEAVRAASIPNVAAMLGLQLRTGMRPAEACGLRAGDVDRSVTPWRYVVRPDWNKKDHLGDTRTVWIGPRGREILGPWLEGKKPNDYVFTTRQKGRYAVTSYRDRVIKACRRAGVPEFSPNQIRHTHGTEIRGKAGLEAAGAVLGHSDLDTTKLYAEQDSDLAARTAEEHG